MHECSMINDARNKEPSVTVDENSNCMMLKQGKVIKVS